MWLQNKEDFGGDMGCMLSELFGYTHMGGILSSHVIILHKNFILNGCDERKLGLHTDYISLCDNVGKFSKTMDVMAASSH